MKIETSMASQLYSAARKLDGGEKIEQSDPSFADALESAMREMRNAINRGENASIEAMSGRGDVQSVVEALTATEMALETAVVVRDKVVEAYQEIMRMPV